MTQIFSDSFRTLNSNEVLKHMQLLTLLRLLGGFIILFFHVMLYTLVERYSFRDWGIKKVGARGY